MRHATAPGTLDPPGARFDDCATQRNLDEQGRDEAYCVERVKEWTRRRNGPVIARLTQDCDAKRAAITANVLAKLNGRLTDDDKRYIEKAFHLLQNQFLHGPISALDEAAREGHGGPLLEALRKLFRLPE